MDDILLIIKRIETRLDCIDQRLINIESKIDIVDDEFMIYDCSIDKLKVFRDQNINIISYLDENNIDSDIDLVKRIYFEDIKNNKYNLEENMYDKIIENIKNAYLSVNNYQNYENDIDKFMKNQSYIIELSSEKYKSNFRKKLNTSIHYLKSNIQ
jgi:hypothetical protein